MDNNAFEIKVKTWLIIKGMKQKDLAKMLEISNPYLSDILSGKRNGKKVRGKIMKILDVKEAS
ncbi:helix-turn-helix transcriptional regulator [Bacillus thuringiensis]|nr:helix-turn-helix transcriptional regulator [Bacillus thuringiensis]MRB58372.1 helix-turn-helix domain-containing protein [Bacillus thuringiensis]